MPNAQGSTLPIGLWAIGKVGESVRGPQTRLASLRLSVKTGIYLPTRLNRRVRHPFNERFRASARNLHGRGAHLAG